MSVGDVSLSLIVPAYNEAVRIGAPLVAMGEFLAAQPYESEIVIIDDGSSDDTCGVVRRAAPTLPVPLRLVRYAPNRGKGYALKVGFALARGDRLVFTDCDLSTSLESLPDFLAALDRGADLAIGYRKGPEALITRRQPLLRESLGKAYTLIVRRMVAQVTDATCGLKAYRHDVGKDLFAHSVIDDWSFDAEILRIARKRGYRLAELPVRWEDRDGSKVSLVRDVIRSLIGIARILWNDRMGVYDQPVSIGPTTEESWGDPIPGARGSVSEFG